MGRVEFWLSYDNGRERLRLPVNPETITISSPFNHTDVAVTQLGEVSIFGDRGLKEFSFNSFFPYQYNPSYCEYSGFKDRWLMVETLERWRDFKKPIRLTVAGTRINYAVTIRDFNYEAERAGHVGDIIYSLTLKEYRFFGSSSKTQRPATNTPAATGKKTHTVKSGESLPIISKIYYKTTADWRKIYDANKSVIGPNANVIQPGMKLVIP